ncbi:rhomboid family intramembrane serine protease [Actinopolymorpha alba]|uniref:rhomboid family intramembrane serine protease n=1 Tax=Actinopolymorpha alba TaxID=533267 RepID=UPI00035DA809|nr:rhomboid family intramembrane serine protease [Actinopolymorpha alba]
MTYGYSRPPGQRGALGRSTDSGVSGLKVLILLVGLMWVAEFVDTFLGHRLDSYGIEARDADGLIGILTAPFLHAGFGHLLSNTIPLLMLGAIIAVAGAVRLLVVTAVVGLVSGVGTWLTSPPMSITIGASGLVFGYATYLIVRGLFNRSIGQLLIGALVVIVWGGALLGGLLPQDGISWQGHLFGAVGGIVTAWILGGENRRALPSSDRYG